jgi:aminoglycoside 6'-N-acetyltransferase I
VPAPFSITPLDATDESAIAQLAAWLPDAFHIMAPEFMATPEEALEEIHDLLKPEHINLIARDDSGVVGWIGGQPMYDGHVMELHPLAVRPDRQRQGVGRALVEALEAEAAARGAITLWLGSDDQAGMTSLSGIDVYPDPLAHLAQIQDVAGHPYRFYQRCGFVLVGLMPDANGFGKPDLYLAKRIGGETGVG